MKNRGWDVSALAAQAGLTGDTIETLLSGDRAPDVVCCYRLAGALGKQPERLLHMSGQLSEAGLDLALKLARHDTLDERAVFTARRRLSLDERRLILHCAQLRGDTHPLQYALRPAPHEFNRQERRQDRIRFALLIGGFVGLIIAGSIGCGLLLR
jgi:hypothetical protein